MSVLVVFKRLIRLVKGLLYSRKRLWFKLLEKNKQTWRTPPVVPLSGCSFIQSLHSAPLEHHCIYITGLPSYFNFTGYKIYNCRAEIYFFCSGMPVFCHRIIKRSGTLLVGLQMEVVPRVFLLFCCKHEPQCTKGI